MKQTAVSRSPYFLCRARRASSSFDKLSLHPAFRVTSDQIWDSTSVKGQKINKTKRQRNNYETAHSFHIDDTINRKLMLASRALLGYDGAGRFSN